MNITKNAIPRRRARRRVLAVAGAAACAVSTGLLTAAPASAESRGFVVTNNSSATLRLQHVKAVDCDSYILCPYGNYPFDFEGRPHNGTEIEPKGSQRFELKYRFSFLHMIQYAAEITYKIEKSNDRVEVYIETTPSSNNSRCEVVPASAGRCTAAGTNITFTR
jgi:hypothetical protein